MAERRMSPKSVYGPIGIVQMSGEEAREGPIPYFGLMAALSLNLAMVNLLPIPILDGATIFMLLVEMFMRRDLSLRVKEAAFRWASFSDGRGGVRALQRHFEAGGLSRQRSGAI
jgi:regulator of sigma E protease